MLLRELSACRVSAAWSYAVELVRFSKFILRVMSLVVILVVGSILLYLISVQSVNQSVIVLLLALPLIPLLALANIQSAIFKSFDNVILGVAHEILFRPTALLVITLLILFTMERTNVFVIIVSQVIIALFIYLLGIAWARRTIPRFLRMHEPTYNLKWHPSLIPLSILAGGQLVNNYADMIMLGAMARSQDVAMYKVAVQLSMFVAFILSIANMVIAPNISRLYYKNDFRELQKILTITSRISLVFALGSSFCFFVFGRNILGLLFGEQFESAYFALLMLSLGQLVNVASGSVLLILNMTGNERLSAFVLAVTSMLNILLNLIFIPKFGLNGAAVATLVTVIIWNLSLCFLIRKKLSLDSTPLGLSSYVS